MTIRDVCTYGGTVVPCPTAGGGPRVTRLTGGARCAGCLPRSGVSATGTRGGCYIIGTAGESSWTYCTGCCLSEKGERHKQFLKTNFELHSNHSNNVNLKHSPFLTGCNILIHTSLDFLDPDTQIQLSTESRLRPRHYWYIL